MDQQTVRPTDTEVVVMGAGIIGAHNAIQCAKRGLKVVLIDNIAGQTLSFKVGESLLVFSNMFLRTISELDDYNSTAFPKDGVWFTYGMEGATSFDGRAEWALQSVIPQSMRDAFVNPRLLRALVDDVQIVRPEAETLLHETARAHPNITFIDDARVKDAVISKDGSEHEVTWSSQTSGQTGTIRTKWIIDCSGRNRFLAKRLGHAVENIECNDGFRNSAIWAQFGNVPENMFGDEWSHHFGDGGNAKRNHNTLHLWGDGYWIWVIPLSQDRISIGVSYDHRTELPGKNYKEKFWNIIRRYPLFDSVLVEENILEFNVFKNCQHMTDTFVSSNRYGMVGDAASVIDAYYSQGMSLALVTSWHITNIIERDLRENQLDGEYIDRVNIHTRMDWHIMRNLIKAKYTRAIRDSRFFLLSHLLDMVTFVGIAFPRYQLARWLVDTDGNTANEKPFHRQMRHNLMKTLFYSRRRLIGPERVQKFQRYFQERLVERALWRLDHNVVVPNLRCLVRTPAGMIRFWRLLFPGSQSFIDISPKPMAEPPKWLYLTGEENKPRVLKFAGPLMTIIFVLMYFFDWFATALARVRFSANPSKEIQRFPVTADRLSDSEGVAQTMLPEDVAILRDPVTLESLQYFSAVGPNERSGVLRNAKTGKEFPVRNRISMFLDQSEVTGTNRKFQKFYDLFAPVYDAMIKSFLFIRRMGNDEQMRTEYLNQLEIKPGDKVLEVSIGTGSNMRYMPKTCKYFGLDISLGMLKRCEKNLKKWKLDFELFFGAAESLPFADNEFDVVFHAGGIKFFSDKRQAINEMIRVAKPGTKIMIMDQADKLADDVLKVPIARQFFKGLKEMTVAPVDLVPAEMEDVRLDYVLNGGCYLLEFRKPAASAARLVDQQAA